MILLKIKKLCSFGTLLLTISFFLCSCASMSSSLILGIGTGSVTGAVITQNGQADVGTGAAVGAVIGGLSAYFIHKNVEKREEKTRRDTLLNLEKFDVSTPSKSGTVSVPTEGGHYLTKPVVDMEWIEAQVQGDKLIEGHRVWKIIEKPKWIPTREDEKK